jgi:pimeloyl-ACP methyl ester carboxylesterase
MRGDINVRAVGEGNQTWLLVHPFSGSGRFWEARAAALATEHRLRVLSPDLPSHGRSRIVERFDYDRAADAIAGALAPQRANIALIVGASSGATVAMKLAARWQKPVVAIGGWFAFSATNIENMRRQSRELPPSAAQFANQFLEQGPPQLAAFRRHFGDLADYGEAPLLRQAEIAALVRRTLLINGGADKFLSREGAHALADAIPGSVLSFVTGADHLEPLAAAHRDFTWAQIAAFARTHTT